MDHREEALRLLEAALEEGNVAGAAAVHALLHLAETVQHGLRDLVYELRS